MKSTNNQTLSTGAEKTEKKSNDKYSKSFLAKIIQSDEQTKRHYSVLKNELLSYEGVKCSFDWRWESFSVGRKPLAKLRWRGKTLSICLALNAEDYVGSRYDVENLADTKSLADTPCSYLIKDYKRLMYATQLIGVLMDNNGVAKTSAEEIDYTAQYPYETDEALIKKKLIKVSTEEDAQSDAAPTPSAKEQSVSTPKADTKSDAASKPSAVKKSAPTPKADVRPQKAVVASQIEKSDAVSDKTLSDIVNIDTLSQCFAAGERVTLSEIKNRVKGFNPKVTYIKVLARGTLNKALTVEADAFSGQAAKMIALAGGTAIKKGGLKK